MRSRGLARALAIATGVVAMSSTVVEAQTFNYFTTGYFSSPFAGCNGAPAGTTTSPPATTTATCTGGGFTLTYTGQALSADGYLSGSQTEFGDFALTGGPGNVTVPGGSVLFTLLINQVDPTTGVGAHAGFITGQVIVQAGPDLSTLTWMPNITSTIGPVTYTLDTDVAGGVRIPAPPGVKTITGIATVNVIPEPSTYVLLGSGLLGLAGLARRRRTAV